MRYKLTDRYCLNEGCDFDKCRTNKIIIKTTNARQYKKFEKFNSTKSRLKEFVEICFFFEYQIKLQGLRGSGAHHGCPK